MLFTSLPVETFEQAQTIIGWYQARWEIELFFRTLKQGCQVQKLQLETEHRLENALAIYLVIAWHIHALTMIARHHPDEPCTVMLSEREWHLLFALRAKKASPIKPPSLREAVRLLAQLGGFLARKGDGEPGLKTVWRGYIKLITILNALDALNGVQFGREKCV